MGSIDVMVVQCIEKMAEEGGSFFMNPNMQECTVIYGLGLYSNIIVVDEYTSG